MKTMRLLIFLLMTWSYALAAEPSFWVGECLNKTSGDRGFVRMVLTTEEPAAAGKAQNAGYLGVSGWLVGGGEFTVQTTGPELKFQTKDYAPIEWTGKIQDGTFAGSYSIPAIGEGPVQTGEFSLRKVPVKPGSEGVFRQILAILTEFSFNAPPAEESGATVNGKQLLFDAIHPVGTASSVRVTDVEIEWQKDSPKATLADIRKFTVDLTLYWAGPLTKAGWTKMRLAYNAELRELSGYQVLETNGVTKEKVGTIAKEVGIILGTAAAKMLLEDK